MGVVSRTSWSNNRQRDINIMLDQLRLESYCCCKLRLTTAVAVLGWVGILVSVLVIVGGILLAVIPPVLSEQFILILPDLHGNLHRGLGYGAPLDDLPLSRHPRGQEEQEEPPQRL